jgi:methionyl aminopeptidase
MRAAGRLVFETLCEIESQIGPGVTTAQLNEIAEKKIADAGAKALFLGVENPQARFPFPASICSSVNEEVVHGIPDDRPLAEGDIVSVDCGVRLKGYCGDSARTFAIGVVDAQTTALLRCTREALQIAIDEARPGVAWSSVARKMQQHVERAGFGVVREFVGHGIGREMHEEPKVPNYADRNGDFQLAAGMTLAVEPMVTAGRPAVVFRDRDCWSVVTKDRSNAAHFEHAIAITNDGCTVLSDGS